MIIRILNGGQWELGDAAVAELNTADDAVEAAVGSADQGALTTALQALHDQIRASGTPVPDDELADSDLIVPDVDATLAEVTELLGESEQGLIPG